MGKWTAAKSGFWSGIKYAAKGKKNNFVSYADWEKEFPSWEKAQLAGMFVLAAAEIVTTYWGYSSLMKDMTATPAVRGLGAVSIVTLGCFALRASWRCAKEARNHYRWRKLVRKGLKQNTP
ncbi:MAG: hypothetical protein PHY92_03335 [Alphaproteobacteria bacterium]|nr:hypothetical protein [Alphaproteobacteria bacterium]